MIPVAARKARHSLNSPGFGPGCFLVFALSFGASVLTAHAEEQQKPLFELGVAGGIANLPDYPAAGQNHWHGIALPYVAYRGDFLRSDDKGLIRGRFVHTDDVELDVSLNGSFPTRSRGNDARRGMPDLDYLVEIGPRLQATLARAARDAKIDLELPIRAVFSTDFSSVDHRGFTFAPQLAYQNDRFLDAPIKLKLGIGPIFGSAALMDYFYEVTPTFATATRPAYAVDAGYIGTRLEFGMTSAIFPRTRAFLASRIDVHRGAANEDSPLFRDRMTYSIGLGLIVSVFQSEHRVQE